MKSYKNLFNIKPLIKIILLLGFTPNKRKFRNLHRQSIWQKTFNFSPFVLCLLTFILLIGGNKPTTALNVDDEIETQLLDFSIPELPSLGNADLYLLSPQEVAKVEVIIKLSERKVYVYQQNQVIASFPIAVGKKGWETPQGNFSIIEMVQSPSWQNPWSGKVTPPGPNNPLGDRWIGFWTDGKNTIGFHGTPGEHLIGQAVSHGCVRMRNKDVRALFDLVAIGTPVIVKP